MPPESSCTIDGGIVCLSVTLEFNQMVVLLTILLANALLLVSAGLGQYKRRRQMKFSEMRWYRHVTRRQVMMPQAPSHPALQ